MLFPYDTEKEFATKGKVPVKATFKSSLEWKPRNSNTRKILQTRPKARYRYIRKKVKPKGVAETLQRLGEKE